MKKILLIAAGIVFLVMSSVATTCSAQEIIAEITEIVSGRDIVGYDVDEGKVVFSFKDSIGSMPAYGINMWDSNTNAVNEITKLEGYVSNIAPAICKDRIVYVKMDLHGFTRSDVYLYDTSSGEGVTTLIGCEYWWRAGTNQSDNPVYEDNPAIYGDYVVWEKGMWDSKTSKVVYPQIAVYNILTQEKKYIPTVDTYKKLPKIYDGKIVYHDCRDGSYDIYMYDISTGTERKITANASNKYYPDISGNYIVWVDYRNGTNGDIYMYDLSTDTEKPVIIDASAQSFPAISGNHIVYEDYRFGNVDIYMRDLTTGIETPVVTDSRDQKIPHIQGNNIVWLDNGTTLCMATFSAIVNHPPVISGTPSTMVNGDTVYMFTPMVSDVDIPYGDMLTFSIENKPSWANFNITTGSLTGITPMKAGIYSGIKIIVTDKAGAAAAIGPFSITVKSVPPIVIPDPPSTIVNEDAFYSFTPTFLDIGDVLIFSIVNKPSWTSFNTTTGVLSGTPTNDNVGVTTGIKITVKSGSGVTASIGPFSITVNNVNDSPVISGTPSTMVNGDTVYMFTPMVSDVDIPYGDMLTFSIENKPSWANFNITTGSLTGITPMKAGIYSGIKIIVTDKAGAAAAIGPFSITVKSVPPVISGTVKINNNAQHTNSRNVTLSLSATGSGVSKMKISNTNPANWSAITEVAYLASKSWTLTTGNGTKTVYVKFKDVAGNWSRTISDSIMKR